MKTFRNVSWVVFLISIFALIILFQERIGVALPGHHIKTEPTVILSTATAVCSLISGIITSIVSLRKDRLDTRKTELELEKTRLEIAKLRKDSSSVFVSKTGLDK